MCIVRWRYEGFIIITFLFAAVRGEGENGKLRSLFLMQNMHGLSQSSKIDEFPISIIEITARNARHVLLFIATRLLTDMRGSLARVQTPRNKFQIFFFDAIKKKTQLSLNSLDFELIKHRETLIGNRLSFIFVSLN